MFAQSSFFSLFTILLILRFILIDPLIVVSATVIKDTRLSRLLLADIKDYFEFGVLKTPFFNLFLHDCSPSISRF
jgi:hypothetical protein